MSDMFNFSSPPEASNDGFQLDASASEGPNVVLPHDELGQGADSGYVTVTASSTDIETASTAQKKRHKHLAFLKFVQVQGGLMCKSCDSVLKTNDPEPILRHLCKCPKARPGDKETALSVYEQRYRKKTAVSAMFTNASRPSIVTSSPSATFPGPSAAACLRSPAPTTMDKWVDCVTKSEQEDLNKD
ncbi:hypothetical protein E4U26_001936 [Claviceps purpurea]|nr:hypothetical protein E4U26_001936 [Claviceps purpurea]